MCLREPPNVHVVWRCSKPKALVWCCSKPKLRCGAAQNQKLLCGAAQAHQQQQYGLMQECQTHMAVVEDQASWVLAFCFRLLSVVSEVDTMVRIMLQALGPKAQPHFAAITAELPQASTLPPLPVSPA